MENIVWCYGGAYGLNGLEEGMICDVSACEGYQFGQNKCGFTVVYA